MSEHNTGQPARKTRYYSGPITGHFDGRRFQGVRPGGFRKLGKILAWQLFGSRARWPRWIENGTFPPPPERVHGDALRVTMIGHSTVLLQTAGMNILTDPVWSQRASPFQWAGPRRVRAPGLPLDVLPPVDLVFISHNHYDHLDLATISRLVEKFNPAIITPLGNDAIILKAVPTARVRAIDWDDCVKAGPLLVEAEPVNHWSARGPNDQNEALWAGMTIHAAGRRIFFNGDSGFADGWWIERLMAKHSKIDFCILPIGAYAPRWFMQDLHMNPEEAVEAFKRLGCPPTLGHHWGTFQLTDEPINEPTERLLAELARQEIDVKQFRTLEPGQSWPVYEEAGKHDGDATRQDRLDLETVNSPRDST